MYETNTLNENTPDELKCDKGFVLNVLKYRGASLKYAHETLRDNKDIVLAAMVKSKKCCKFPLIRPINLLC
jgi:hypothetical protein